PGSAHAAKAVSFLPGTEYLVVEPDSALKPSPLRPGSHARSRRPEARRNRLRNRPLDESAHRQKSENADTQDEEDRAFHGVIRSGGAGRDVRCPPAAPGTGF